MSKISIPASMSEFVNNPLYAALFALAEEISDRPAHQVHFGRLTCEDTGTIAPAFLVRYPTESDDA